MLQRFCPCPCPLFYLDLSLSLSFFGSLELPPKNTSHEKAWESREETKQQSAGKQDYQLSRQAFGGGRCPASAVCILSLTGAAEAISRVTMQCAARHQAKLLKPEQFNHPTKNAFDTGLSPFITLLLLIFTQCTTDSAKVRAALGAVLLAVCFSRKHL